MKQAKTFLVEGKSMTVRDLIDSDLNVHNLTDGQIRARLAANDRTLANILRPVGSPWVYERKHGKGPAMPDVAPQQEEVAVSDGSSASYYVLPEGAKELQDLISYKDMNGQIAEIFRACYRYGEVGHSPKLRDAKKIKFYIDAEIKRLGG